MGTYIIIIIIKSVFIARGQTLLAELEIQVKSEII